MTGEELKPAETWQWLLFFAGIASIYLFIGLGRGWLMRAIQITIVMAVIGSNIQWTWTHSGFLAGVFGIGAAYALTIPPIWLWDRLRREPRAGVSRGVVEREQSTKLDT